MPRPLRPVTPVGLLALRLEQAWARVDALIPTDAAAASDPGGGAASGPGGSRLVLEALRRELGELATLAGGLEPYVAANTTPESPALAALAARTEARDWEGARPGGVVALEAEMLSGHVEGQLLKFLVAMTGARRVLEVGMFTGYSALALAEALGPGGRVVAAELDPEVAAFAEASFAEAADRATIEVHVGPAADTLAALAAAGASFELVFIDADKSGYLHYVDRILETGLLAEGGTICVDNTLMQGEPWSEAPRSANGEAIRAFNAAIADDPRVEQVMVPLRDGVTLIRRRA